MKIQKEFDPIQGTTTVRIEKTREDVTPVVEYKKFISKGIEITNSDGETEVVNQRVEAVLPENGPRSTLFQTTLSDGTDVKAAVEETVAKTTFEYAEKNGQRSVIEMKYRQPTGEAKPALEDDPNAVAKPVISIDEDGNVTITAAAGDIYYTTDDSTPTSGSTKYTASFAVEDGTTVKAIAVVKEENEETGEVTEYVSAVATKKYTVASEPSEPSEPSTYTLYYGYINGNLDTTDKVTDEGFVINGDVLKGLSSKTITSKSNSITYTATEEEENALGQSFPTYAYPASLGEITKYTNNVGTFDVADSYTRFEVDVDGVTYYAYVQTFGHAPDAGDEFDFTYA